MPHWGQGSINFWLDLTWLDLTWLDLTWLDLTWLDFDLTWLWLPVISATCWEHHTETSAGQPTQQLPHVEIARGTTKKHQQTVLSDRNKNANFTLIIHLALDCWFKRSFNSYLIINHLFTVERAYLGHGTMVRECPFAFEVMYKLSIFFD